MKHLTALLIINMIMEVNAFAAISTTSTNTVEQTVPTTPNPSLKPIVKKETLPVPKSADSYETPTVETGDLSAKGEASATSHETRPLNHKKSRQVARQKSTTKVNCDVAKNKELCERTEMMNKSMHERTDRETAEQRGQTKQADRSFE